MKAYEFETVTAVSVRAWGFYVSTYPTDGGLTIGLCDKTYIYPKREITYGSREDLTSLFLDPSKEEARRIRRTKRLGSLSDLGVPVAVLSEQIGIVFDVNSQRIGMTVGFKLQEIIRLPSDHEGILFLLFDSMELNKMEIYIRENTLTQEGASNGKKSDQPICFSDRFSRL